jgi:hypothetical protein
MVQSRSDTRQLELPGVITAGGRAIALRNHKIPHTEILDAFERSEGARGVVEIFRTEVIPIRTRTLRLVGRKTPASITNTLLGYELRAGFKRIQCPDMVTARYLKLFTELGCHSIRLPYDPTVTARIVPELERAVERIEAGVRELFPSSASVARYVTRRIYSLLRARLRESLA